MRPRSPQDFNGTVMLDRVNVARGFAAPRATCPRPPERTFDQHRDVIDAPRNHGEQPHPMQAACVVAGATMPMHHGTSSAIYQLDRWVRGEGFTPEHGPRLSVTGESRELDGHGNSLGGIRLPPVYVPVATYLTDACALGGLPVPFTEAQLLAPHPTFDVYRSAVRARTDEAVRQGWLLPPMTPSTSCGACAGRRAAGRCRRRPCPR